MMLSELLPQVLFLFGVGFLVANLRVGLELFCWVRRRSSALLVWQARKPPYYGLCLGIGVVMGVLLLVKAALRPPQASDLAAAWAFVRQFATQQFGELMMFIYYGYAVPLSTRIARGLYADGIWSDTGFMRYDQIGGMSWRDGERPTLVLVSRFRNLARRLEVPGPALGEARRLLREKISSHAIAFEDGPGLHLGDRDLRDTI